MLPALLYLTVRNPPWYVWVLNLTIAVVYFAVAVLGSVGAVRFIVLVRPDHLVPPPGFEATQLYCPGRRLRPHLALPHIALLTITLLFAR